MATYRNEIQHNTQTPQKYPDQYLRLSKELPDEVVCFVIGSFITGINSGLMGQCNGRMERCHADDVGKGFHLVIKYLRTEAL